MNCEAFPDCVNLALSAAIAADLDAWLPESGVVDLG